MSNHLLFQYCPKIAVFKDDSVLLCRRKGEQDYDGVFSLIGGKLERTDGSIENGIRREKTEEVGKDFLVDLLPRFSIDVLFEKRDGNPMVLPHFYARYVDGPIVLSAEYSEYRWTQLDELDQLNPVIENVRWIVPALYKLGSDVDRSALVRL